MGGGYEGAAAGLALDCEPSAERGHPVGDPDEPVPARIGASDAVVANLDAERPIVHACADLGLPGVRVLDDVGERLGDDEVGARLDLRREPLGRQIDLNR